MTLYSYIIEANILVSVHETSLYDVTYNNPPLPQKRFNYLGLKTIPYKKFLSNFRGDTGQPDIRL